MLNFNYGGTQMKKIILYTIIFIIFSLFSINVYSQNEQPQWIWGEAENIDLNTKQLTLKYLDYDTDEEKDLIVNVDTQTTFENASGLLDIRPGDNVSCDFIVTPEGNTIAKNISIEKPPVEGSGVQAEATQEETTTNQEQAPTPQSTSLEQSQSSITPE